MFISLIDLEFVVYDVCLQHRELWLYVTELFLSLFLWGTDCLF